MRTEAVTSTCQSISDSFPDSTTCLATHLATHRIIPVDWYISLHEWLFFGVNVVSLPYVDGMGNVINTFWIVNQGGTAGTKLIVTISPGFP